MGKTAAAMDMSMENIVGMIILGVSLLVIRTVIVLIVEAVILSDGIV